MRSRCTPRRGTRDQRGAAAVEFGLIAIILFTLLFGIIQFGFWFWAWQAGAHAAREASRFAAVNPCDQTKIKAAGGDALAGAPIVDTPAWTVTTTSPVEVGGEVTVHVTFTTLDLNLFPGFDGVVDKSATSRIENLPPGGC